MILKHAKTNAINNPTAIIDGRIHKTWLVDVDVWAEKKLNYVTK